MKDDLIEYSGVCHPSCFPAKKQILCCKQISLTETIVLPPEKPNIEQIVQVYARAKIDHYKIIASPIGRKIYMKGTLSQQILYVADQPTQPVHATHSVVPFCNFIDIHPSCTKHQYQHLQCTSPKVLIEFLEAVAVNPREISKCAILFFWFSRPPQPKCVPTSDPCSDISDLFSRQDEIIDINDFKKEP